MGQILSKMAVGLSVGFVLSVPTVRAEDTLSTVMNATQNEKFTGSPITLKLKDADVHEVLRMISEASGFNIVIHPSVTGKITVSLEDVPWDQALDVVLTTLKLGAERNQSVLRVLPREMLMAEKQSEIDAKKLIASAAPKVTRIFPISYADLSQLSSLLIGFTSPASSQGKEASTTTIIVDATTQSLVVRDTAENLERIRKMIQLLDVQTPQVMIEAKAIDATESFTRELGSKMNLKQDWGTLGINGGAGLTGAATSVAASAGTAVAAGNANTFNFSIGKGGILNALLNYSESQSLAKVVSSPKVIVMSGKTANVVQGSNLPVAQAITQGTNTTTGTIFVPYNTSLSVTPRVANDGSVLMKLNLSRDTVEKFDTGTATAPRNITTEVIVESGNTLVIGGVQSIDRTESEAGFPGLRKIPLLGWLFGSEGSTNKKSEVMFFITPRILNQKKTALGNPDSIAPDNQSPAPL